jgi:CIC family chloride channel protein
MLGIIGGLLSTLFCKGLLKLRGAFLRLPPKTIALQPAIGGLIVGALLVFVPQVMSVGYEYVDQALSGGMLLKTMLLLGVAKLVATIISYASGNAGGIFAPSLFLGAMFGGVVGSIVHLWAPFPTGAIGAYALVGMGTLFAGIIRAPMTSVFMIFELTQDYQILVPLMIANMLSFIISRRFQPRPVYSALLEQNGIHLPENEARSGRSSWRVKDVMTTNVNFLRGDATIQETWKNIQNNGASAYLLGSRNQVTGSVTKRTIQKALQDGRGAESLDAIADKETVSLHDDEPLEVALERFDTNHGIVAILSRNGARGIRGVVTLETIMEFIHKKPQ